MAPPLKHKDQEQCQGAWVVALLVQWEEEEVMCGVGGYFKTLVHFWFVYLFGFLGFPNLGGMNLGNLLSNPAFMNMASLMCVVHWE